MTKVAFYIISKGVRHPAPHFTRHERAHMTQMTDIITT